MIVIVAGVSGSGKSTVGALLAGRLGWPFIDGDLLHPSANIAKMRRGEALTDEDRLPWLRAISELHGRTNSCGRFCARGVLGAEAKLPRATAWRPPGSEDRVPAD